MLPNLLDAIENIVGCCEVRNVSMFGQLTTEVKKSKGLTNIYLERLGGWAFHMS